MSIRIVLVVSGLVALLFGAFMLFAADAAIQGFQLGASDVPSRLFARAEGASLIGFAIINLMASGDRFSPALRGIVAGNLFIHVMGIAVDFTETFPRTGGWFVAMAIHVIFIIAFGTYLLRWRQVQPA